MSLRLHAPNNEEDFDLDVSPISSDDGDTRAPAESLPAPSSPTQQPEKPAGGRTADVFGFYKIDGGKRKCTFCMYVPFFASYLN
jgi:hypothetical protein